MAFDDLSSTQEVPFTPSPIRKADLPVWKMPEPSNPGLRSLIDNAKDSCRANPSPSESHWAFSPPEVTSNSTTFISRASNRTYPKQSTSSSLLETNKALAQLIDPNYMMSIANFANQRAKERSKELGGPVMKRAKGALKATKVEKSRGSVVKGGKIRKRSDAKGKAKGKEMSSAFIQPMLDEGSSVASSSSNSMLDDSMSVDTSFSSDAALHTASSSTSPGPQKPTAPIRPSRSTKPVPVEHTSSTQTTKTSDPDIKFHPLLFSNGKPPPQPTQIQENTQRPIARSVLASQSKPSDSAQALGPATIPPSLTFPRPSGKPPVLGMRRAATLPAKSTTTSTNTRAIRTTAQKELPTKQRSFKTPFLPSTQRSSDNQSAGTTSQIFARETSMAPKNESRQSEDDDDVDYGDDSFDMEALEETLKKYD
ncbi:hypothetical protein BT96DRAFT_971930 [Gymnopus androsaceus JB14]|uniref:Uncharacterized protein n=1 Tax=Gymnopus androsaceus JB14 TaxID=1447944 RepID=A0A6A4IBE7_9AGAR|nr:hypothetical protein BT96DRAFT_971930 [Gymnopus androsaceus JB14]